MLRQSLPESCHQLPCRCVRVRVRSSSVAPAARGSTCSPLRRRHVSTQRPTSPSNHPHHPLDKRLERVHSAHLPVKVPPRVSCRLVTLGSVPSRTHCPQHLSLPRGTTESAGGAWAARRGCSNLDVEAPPRRAPADGGRGLRQHWPPRARPSHLCRVGRTDGPLSPTSSLVTSEGSVHSHEPPVCNATSSFGCSYWCVSFSS